jgi:hypothetical protein
VILVVEEGRIVERGRHDELLEAGGLYSELYTTQFEHQSDGADVEGQDLDGAGDPSDVGAVQGSGTGTGGGGPV